MSINERETRKARTTRSAGFVGFLKTAGGTVARTMEAWGEAMIMNQMPDTGTIFRTRKGDVVMCVGYDQFYLDATDGTSTAFTWLEVYSLGLTKIWPVAPCTREHVPDPTFEDINRSFYGAGE